MEAWLETFAVLALLLGINSTGAEWYTESSTDPIDDTRSAIALRVERPGPWTRTGRYRLLILFCEEPRPKEKPALHAVVAWNMSAEDLLKPVDVERQEASRTTTEILTRFGDEQAQSWTYERVGTANEMFLTIPHEMDRFLREAKRATEVALRLEHDETGKETTVFDLTGSARVMNAMESGCKLLGPAANAAQHSAAGRPDKADQPSTAVRSTAAPPHAAVEERGLVSLPADERAWIEASCSRDLGPAIWSSCIRREVEAVKRGVPDISDLASHNQAWIRSSCSRDLGPAIWSSCMRREVEAVRRGMPNISDLAADNQAWILSSCSRDLGPAIWSSCVRREVEAVRRIQRQ